MGTYLLTAATWAALSAAARSAKRPAHIAVAYFGKGASRLLKLQPGSRLVVDASEHAVKSGQTSPEDLLRLVKKGVRVYSVANLHAKVYVLGSKAFIGSANTSKHSKGSLIEAMLCTTDREAVSAAKEFVSELCLQPMTPKQLEGLQALYRPPKFGGHKPPIGRKRTRRVRPALERVHVVQLVREDYDADEESVADAGRLSARKQQRHPRAWDLDEFEWYGKTAFARGETVVQIVKEDGGMYSVLVPGRVVHVERQRVGRRAFVFVYLECESGRRARRLARVAKRLGPGARKRLLRGGYLNSEFAESLLTIWNPEHHE